MNGFSIRSVIPPGLLGFLIRRAVAGALLVVGISAVSFTLTQIVPGDPAAANLSQQALGDPTIVAAFRHEYGLDQPVPVQYVLYLKRLVHGDLGTSEHTHRPVLDDLGEFLPATAELGITAMLIAIPLGVALGTVAALNRNRFVDQALRLVSLAGLSVPNFWLALISLYLLFYKLSIFPISGRLSPGVPPPPHVTGLFTIDAILGGQPAVFTDALQHLVLPALVLAAYTTGFMTRFARSAVLDVLGQDYIRAAQAKGLRIRYIITRHVLLGASPAIVTMTGLALGGVLTGTVLVESIFSWPGIGQYAFRSATNLDLPGIMGVSIFAALTYVGVNLVVDVLQAVIDPRIRLA